MRPKGDHPWKRYAVSTAAARPLDHPERQLRDALALVGRTRDDVRAVRALRALIERAWEAEKELALAQVRATDLERDVETARGVATRMHDNWNTAAADLSAAQAKLAGVGTTHQIVPVEPTDAIRKAMRNFFVWQSMPDLWGEVWKAALAAAKEPR